MPIFIILTVNVQVFGDFGPRASTSSIERKAAGTIV
ncbi:hypothetical protein HDC92_004328 [Pedobacter sp. AK017]|nr:hypothetical protein [Pedobacter sp. AK017]